MLAQLVDRIPRSSKPPRQSKPPPPPSSTKPPPVAPLVAPPADPKSRRKVSAVAPAIEKLVDPKADSGARCWGLLVRLGGEDRTEEMNSFGRSVRRPVESVNPWC